MKYPINLREEELKNRVGEDFFWQYDYHTAIGNIDFTVCGLQSNSKSMPQSLVWAEAKRGTVDLTKALVQLILTIGKARTFDKVMPPAFLSAFDCQKIAFIPYADVQEVFYLNDFNWNVAPSNHETREFKLLLAMVSNTLAQKSLLFDFEFDGKELRNFIKHNLKIDYTTISKIRIDKNNFIIVYNKWLQTVKPSIAVNWELAKKNGIIDADFYLADLLSQENQTIKEKLYVILNKDHYEFEKSLDEMGIFTIKRTFFKDNQRAHAEFWNKYERPPREQYWNYIVNRRDLLVPQDIRERKGSFFTPQIWVELSQQYFAELLGENWQDEYYIWDCAAGTGNLLAGLTNKYHIWASTLDRQDVDIMRDRIKNGANLLEQHVFQFDFLNDDFSKLPDNLREIVQNPDLRKKLIIYINPPYAEHTSKVNLIRKAYKEQLTQTEIQKKYGELLKKASYELSAQFLIRIYQEIPGCLIGEFSKLKALQSPNFEHFRNHFLAKLERCFIIPSNTFDNVKGVFPIGFKIWNTAKKEKFEGITALIYQKNNIPIGEKTLFAYNDCQYINTWISEYQNKLNASIGFLHYRGNDFQHQSMVFIESLGKSSMTILEINQNNLKPICIYFSVRHCLKATWLNDRDQFLYPNAGWQTDSEFQNDCLAFTLFHSQNRISWRNGTNHWIPFTEKEVNAKAKFKSNFMTNFIQGKLKPQGNGTLLETEKVRTTPLTFSVEAKAVFEAGRKLWAYYHQVITQKLTIGEEQDEVNASLYDIKVYFQGKNEQGRLKSNSTNTTFKELLNNLRSELDALAQKIEPKIYQYGFLKR
ncbi:MAG: hypothetical protein NZ551_03880 [Microscillaceae bacterium]|nr:hypothetical protein [Microscillaceae bacterium]MDW8460329.1 hypothetical protein [Cytophagales bacterium]